MITQRRRLELLALVEQTHTWSAAKPLKPNDLTLPISAVEIAANGHLYRNTTTTR